MYRNKLFWLDRRDCAYTLTDVNFVGCDRVDGVPRRTVPARLDAEEGLALELVFEEVLEREVEIDGQLVGQEVQPVARPSGRLFDLIHVCPGAVVAQSVHCIRRRIHVYNILFYFCSLLRFLTFRCYCSDANIVLVGVAVQITPVISRRLT